MRDDLTLREAAMAMESRAADFFRELARGTENAHMKDLFEYLASEEDAHVAKFAELADVHTTREALDQAFREAGPIMTCLLPEGERPGPCAEDLDDAMALDLAVGFEKDSILFYHALLRHIEDDAAAQQVHDLLETEYDHLHRLSVLRNLLAKSAG